MSDVMPGQILLDSLLEDKLAALEEKYPKPRLRQQVKIDEGWFDDWHYTEIEEPTEADVYYTVEYCNGNFYMFTYKAWANGWYKWDSWFKKWKEDPEGPVMWVRIPSRYRQKDVALADMVCTPIIIKGGNDGTKK